MTIQQHHILQINASSRYQESITRKITQLITAKLTAKLTEKSLDTPNASNDSQATEKVIYRDVTKGLPFIDEAWIEANFTAPEDRSSTHQATLALSNELVAELQQAEHIVIGAPIYNFSVPASLKAWIDLIARARLTFEYTAQGPKGLLKHKKAYVVLASGGVPIGSEMDFASKYLTHVLAFIGITDTVIIDSSTINVNAESSELDRQLAQAVHN